jgi:hypothetical protein
VALADRERIRSGREGIRTVPVPLFTETGNAGLVTAGLLMAADETEPAASGGEAELTPDVTNREQAMTKAIAARGLFMALLLEVEGCAWDPGLPCDQLVASTCLVTSHWQATWLALSPTAQGRQLRDSAGLSPDFADQ